MADSAKPRKIRKKKLGSYPFASVIFSISMALFVLGLFALLLLHANRLQAIIQENLEVQVFLDRDLSEANRIKISKTLASKRYTAAKDNKAQIRYISKEEAAEGFLDNPDEEIALLGDNPLRDSYVMKLKPEYYQADSLEMIKSEIQQTSGIFEVTYVKSLVESVNENLAKIGLILLGFAILLLIVVLVLINNTIKLALFSQRFLIRSMQLVGATSRFIRKPFLTRAFLHGVLAGVVASALLYALMQWAYTRIEDLHLLADWRNSVIVFAALIIAGGFVGWYSTWRAMNKYLRLSLDELY
ncbi:ABC transporter permease [Cesiribacter sp. SM1]|uniref:cell division protein FtsX n=1 Tax=Cesiribacter sp. SM1 TaxID=2861196 RepID=UPI001CD81A26|nr:permease-like cell division protein FtsX [Cesiribacter sp. SM1]